jgi:hypothetical protein
MEALKTNSAKTTEIKPVGKYQYWDIYDQMPDGWQLFPYAGSSLFGTVFISNGKSILAGRKLALLRIDVRQPERQESSTEAKPVEEPKPTEPDPPDPVPFPAKSVNRLARDRFKEQILKDILFDLTVCELEGWDKLEYITELKKLINSIRNRVCNKKELTLELFK